MAFPSRPTQSSSQLARSSPLFPRDPSIWNMSFLRRKRTMEVDSDDSDTPLRQSQQKRRRKATPEVQSSPEVPAPLMASPCFRAPPVPRTSVHQNIEAPRTSIHDISPAQSAANILLSISRANQQGAIAIQYPLPQRQKWPHPLPSKLTQSLIDYVAKVMTVFHQYSPNEMTWEGFWDLLHHPFSDSAAKPVWDLEGLSREQTIGYYCGHPAQHHPDCLARCHSSPDCHFLVVNNAMLFRPSLIVQKTYFVLYPDRTAGRISPLDQHRWRLRGSVSLDTELQNDLHEYMCKYYRQLAAWVVKDCFFNGTKELADMALKELFAKAITF